ncbi:hypothetical protein [Pseudomonas mandelii]|uniref:hypothetical protein n=1 Tax=Pseudomonas mandelii TaxID=75612 RepID=UPI00029A9915|nr:hypothetical protein [Pseudomonas mandelii]
MITETVCVQFSDDTFSRVIGTFGGPQDPSVWPNQVEIDAADPRYLDYVARVNGGHSIVLPTVEELCLRVDQAADAARVEVAGDPLRALEYQRTADEAQAFKAAGYPVAAIPPMVAAWAINGRTPQQAADNILSEAEAYSADLVWIRTTRLAAKEQIRACMASEQEEDAEELANSAVNMIRAFFAAAADSTDTPAPVPEGAQ